MRSKSTYYLITLLLFGFLGAAQDMVINDTFDKAHELAFEGKHTSSRGILVNVLSKEPDNNKARLLLARTNSWDANYKDAREDLNKIISVERKNVDAWISAIKNELYAQNGATALGLSNKALYYLGSNAEIERLKASAIRSIENKKYPKYIDTPEIDRAKKPKARKPSTEKDTTAVVETKHTNPTEKQEFKNRFGINNSFRVFNDVYEPMVFSSFSYWRQTKIGSLIPKINYSNRLNKHGVEYAVDFYPKISKRFYAFVSGGYSNSSIYPNYKVGGELYANLPKAIELSAGIRYVNFDTRNVTVYNASLGHYSGNYYFSFRSYITPKEENLLTMSGNLLVRKYLKDGENFIGASAGFGFSPELRQLRDGDTLLAETLLYIESQRLRLEYQFTPKKSPNIYRANLGVTRQEFVSNTGNFFWAVSAGFAYQVKF